MVRLAETISERKPRRYPLDGLGDLGGLSSWPSCRRGANPPPRSPRLRVHTHPTGLYLFEQRNYSPSLGKMLRPEPKSRLSAGAAHRETSQDPAGYINGANTYQFVMSNPVGSVDPSGLLDLPYLTVPGPGQTTQQFLNHITPPPPTLSGLYHDFIQASKDVGQAVENTGSFIFNSLGAGLGSMEGLPPQVWPHATTQQVGNAVEVVGGLVAIGSTILAAPTASPLAAVGLMLEAATGGFAVGAGAWNLAEGGGGARNLSGQGIAGAAVDLGSNLSQFIQDANEAQPNPVALGADANGIIHDMAKLLGDITHWLYPKRRKSPQSGCAKPQPDISSGSGN